MSELVHELGEALRHRAASAGHPEPETLAAYHAGELDADAASRLQEHLVYCRRCSALLLGLGDLARAVAAAGPATGDAVASAEDTIRTESDRTPTPDAAKVLRPPPTRWGLSRPVLSALAASLLVVTAVLGVRVHELGDTVDRLEQPRINVAVHDLYAADAYRGDDEAVIEIAAEGEPATLILNPAEPGTFDSYRVSIERSDGGRVWVGDGLEPGPWENFSLVLPAGFLPAGSYRLRLSGRDGESWMMIEDFPLRVESD